MTASAAVSLRWWCLWWAAVVLSVVVSVRRVVANDEIDALYTLRQSLTDNNNVMRSWDPTLVNPCTWFHVTCNPADSSVIRLDLGNAQLSGPLVPQLGLLKNLQYLGLFNNNISGPLPPELGNLTKLITIDLYQNKLTGAIPDTFGQLSKLRFLRLNNNSLSGEIPKSLTNVILQVLDLSNNNLTGEVPSSGSFSVFTPMSFANNPNLCGPGTTQPCPGAPPFSPPPPYIHPTTPTRAKDSGTSRTIAITGGAAGGAAFLITVAVIGLVMWLRPEPVPEEEFFDVAAAEDDFGQVRRFPLREIQVATDNFSNRNVLGKGGFGKVYKGRMGDGSLVAVKRLKDRRSPGGELQFQTEIELISMAAHRNLLKLIGFCMTPTERLLVYPYMANGSVAQRLRRRRPGEPPLGWQARVRIAVGAARALEYLHDECDPKIIHRDVKAANILVDEEMEAVVGDFGLAKLMGRRYDGDGDAGAAAAATTVAVPVRGTPGHIAPEYIRSGRTSEKGDVYGFGVTLLELVTGRKAFDTALLATEDDIVLLEWVKRQLREGKKAGAVVDPELRQLGSYGAEVEEAAETLVKVALLCTQGAPMRRPRMAEVVRMLEGEGVAADSWEEWQRAEEIRRRDVFGPPPPDEWVTDSVDDPGAGEVASAEEAGEPQEQEEESKSSG